MARTLTVMRGAMAAVAILASSNALAQPKKDITVGLASSSFATATLRIANELQLFDKRGITMKSVVTDNSGMALAGVLTKSFDLGIIGLPEFVIARARGQNVVSVAVTYSGFATSMVLSKAAADKIGVAPSAPLKRRLKALDGLVIATPSATAGGTVAFKAAAAAEGVNVRMTYISQPAMQAALETGAIDGYLSSAPFWAFPVVKGGGHVWISGPKGEFPEASTPTVTALLLANRDYADANPDVVKALKAVIADLGRVIVERPADVKKAVARLYPDLPADALDLLFSVESLSWNAKQLTPKDLAREIALVKATGVNLPPGFDTLEPAAMLLP